MASPSLPAPAPPTDSESLTEQARKLVGCTVAGRYKVNALIGEGGMGAVYLVEHTLIRKKMALKVLNPDMMKNPEMVARFEREALAAAHIDHPNVVAATDSGRTDDGALFVVLEYIDGQSLRDKLAYGALPAALAIHIVRQVAGALVRAHGMGIIHRDLKPENIMLVSRDGDENVVKVLDFGLAKLSIQALLDGGATSPNELVTRYGAVFGTPAYMAPEQAAGGEVDGRTDLYAVGILFYEMLTGFLPFDGDDSAALLRQQVIAKVPPLRERLPGIKISAALEAVVMRLLEKRPDKRPDSARALLEALEAVVVADGLRYDPSSPGGRPPPRVFGGEQADPSAIQRPTVVAPEDLAASSFGTAETEVEQGLPKSSPGDAVGNQATIAQALQELADPSQAGAGKDGPSLGGLAEQFGATGKQSGGQAALPAPKGSGQNQAKLRAPSVVDLDRMKHEAAPNPDVLTPAPPPTLGERVREASHDAAGWWTTAGWPAIKRFFAAVRVRVPIYWERLLGWVRARLPAERREISQRKLGLIVGAVLALPLLGFVAWLALSGEESAPQTGAMAGYATDREMERSVKSGATDLEKLATKYPSDSRVYRALVRAQAAKQNYAAAVRALTLLVRLDPTMASDDEMAQVAAAAALLPESSEAAIALLESALGDKGVSTLAELADKTTMEPWRGKLAASLQKGTVRALASEATIVLLDLRAAARCEDKRALLKRAGQQGDARTLSYLQRLQNPTGCGPGGQNDCWPCLRRGTVLQATIDAIQKRPH